MLEYVIDLSSVESWDGFIAAFNDGFVSKVGGHWNGNLDAFNDYLFWPEPHPYRRIIRGWQAFQRILQVKKTLDGRSLLEVIEEVFRDNPQAQIDFANSD